MVEKIAFINKKTKELIEVCDIKFRGNVTPMKEFYAVIIDTPRLHPTVAVVDAELVKLRAKHPDIVTKLKDENGVNCESIQYGKYSELGVCVEPWEKI